MSERGRLFLLCFGLVALGAALGYGMALLQHNAAGRLSEAGISGGAGTVTRSAQSRTGVNPVSVDHAPGVNGVGGAVVEIRLFDKAQEELPPAAGLVLTDGQLLIVPAAALLKADMASVTDAERQAYALGPILAVDNSRRLAVFRNPIPSMREGVQLSLESGALYLGREFLLIAPAYSASGWIDSPVLTRSDGSYVYQARVRGQRRIPVGAALIDAASSSLVGVVVAETLDPMLNEVVDADVVRALVDSVDGAAPLELSEYSRRYYEESPEGMLIQLEALVKRQDWQKAVDIATAILAIQPGFQERVAAHVEPAYLALAREAIGGGRLNAALEILLSAERQLTESGQRLMLLADVTSRLGEIAAARRYLHRAVVVEPALSAVVYPRIRQLVTMEATEDVRGGAYERVVDLLEAEIASDPYYAAYHRLLGELNYKRGQYDQAIRSLSTAVSLDPTLDSQLTPFVRTARRRLNTPGYSEVPITSSAGNIHVSVVLNSRSDQFSFLVDTGATFTAISNQVADTLGISSTAGQPLLTLSTANGIVHAPLVTLRSVAVGTAVIQDVDVVILDSLSGADGLLGLSFLDHFTVTVNGEEGRLVLIRR